MKRLFAFALVLLGACASAPDDSSTPAVVVAPLDRDGYAALVHPVMQKQCGSSSCHGQLPRGLRVYGGLGALHLGSPAEEARATYDSIVGLEPERLDAFLAESPRSDADAHLLLLLAKPLAVERHRPGVSLRKGEPAETCIASWLLGGIDPAACADGKL